MGTSKEAARDELSRALQRGVDDGVFPGAVAGLGLVTDGHVSELGASAGRLWPEGGGISEDTFYDLASLTKPLVASAALRMCQQRRIDLHEPVGQLLPLLDGSFAGEKTLAQLLSHRAGLSPWGALYKELPEGLSSAETRLHMLKAAANFRDENAAQNPEQAVSVYSDLGYLVAGEVLAHVHGAALSELVRAEVTAPLGLSDQIFYAATLPESERARFVSRVAPTEFCALRERVVRGEVHDENCAAFGGVSGHAGLFGTARAVLRFGLVMLHALSGRGQFLDQALLRWALTPRPGGGYALGWDKKSREGSSAGDMFSDHAFGHLGFTGTSLWCDPARALCAVLLTNRVHPTRENIAIRSFRPRFHDLAASLSF